MLQTSAHHAENEADPGSRQPINMNSDPRTLNSAPDLDKKPVQKKQSGPVNADSGKLFVGGLNSGTTGD